MNSKKIIYCFAAVLIIAVIVNFLIWMSSGKERMIIDDIENNSIQDISSGVLEEAGMDFPGINVIKTGMTEMIDEVIVEKNPVCTGEDFMVSVRAENPRGKNDSMSYSVSGKKGNPVILNYYAPGEKKLHVFVSDNYKLLDHKVVSVSVVECKDRPSARLQSTFSSSRDGEVDYDVTEMKGLEGQCTYKWDFGDGEGTTTGAGSVSHNYGNREQKAFSSTFIADVTITDSKGASIIARKDVTFPNVQWISSRMGNAVITVAYDRIATPSGDNYEVRIRMKNIFSESCDLQRADVTFMPCAGNNRTETKTFSAGYFINKTYLGACESVEDTLRFNKDIFPFPVSAIKINFVGELSDGREVSALIYLTIPMSGESIQEALKNNNARIVTDSSEINKVKMARAILGTDYVTPEDIKRLEKEGKL